MKHAESTAAPAQLPKRETNQEVNIPRLVCDEIGEAFAKRIRIWGSLRRRTLLRVLS